MSEEPPEHSYGLYCVNIHGSSLDAIRDQFKNQVRTGLRQTVYLIDLEEVQKDLQSQTHNSQQHEEMLNNYNMLLINIISQNIQTALKEYEWLKKRIRDELKFNLYDYWVKQIEEQKKFLKAGEKNLKPKTTGKTGLKPADKLTCNKIVAKAHNKIGQEEQYSKRKYIKDEPIQGKVSIIILGQMDKAFYDDLLSRNLPLEGIVNFVPVEGYYEIMLGNNLLRNFIVNTLNTLNSSVHQMRRDIDFKPIGLFFNNLPVISTCLAAKYSRDIFDQLTWTVFDVQMLKNQYDLYYYRPFQLFNVEIPDDVDLIEYYHKATVLSMDGPYVKSCLPKCGTDSATIASYLNSLLNTCGFSTDINEDFHMNTKVKNSFASIVKIPSLHKIILDESNQLLLNMLQYVNVDRFQPIYDCCLECNVFRKYIFYPQNFPPSGTCCQKIDKIETFILPQYVKYYANADSSSQRIYKLIDIYDEYQIHEIEPGYKLYTFKKHFNELLEKEIVKIIPTRLCFRDFTLFQMAEFLENLKIPHRSSNLTPKEDIDAYKKQIQIFALQFDEAIFIRRNSLKAFYSEKKSSKQGSQQTSRRSNKSKSSKVKKVSLNGSNSIAVSMKSEEGEEEEEGEAGLPADHHLLNGYNLEDTLQELKFRTTKYHFAHGTLQLYEERWCFRDMNKQLTFTINDTSIILSRPRHKPKSISKNVRLITKNDVHIRILNEPQEDSKIVMNYPNGLSIYYNNNNFCVQDWSNEQSSRDEQRRIYTPYGSIIVFYRANDLILIMRHNGEVYQLYQQELGVSEEQSLNNESFEDLQERSSSVIDMLAQGDRIFNNANKKERKKSNSTGKIKTCSKKKSKQKKDSKSKFTAESPLTSDPEKLIENELKYLNFISSIGDLKYVHLIVTTAQGRRINVNSRGRMYETQPCTIKEWRDYFANEDYCQRSDGVKMIWSESHFKCFHKDGTIFTTTTEEGSLGPDTDEIDSQITQSSSHLGQEEEEEAEKQPRLSRGGNKTLRKRGSNLKRFLSNEGAEEHIPEDGGYVCYACNSWFMQHRHYADVRIFSSQFYSTILPLEMNVVGIDNISLRIHTKTIFKSSSEYSDMEMEFEEDEGGVKSQFIDVWINNNLHVSSDEQTLEIYAVLDQDQPDNFLITIDMEKSSESGYLTLRLNYSDSIKDAFKYLVNEIAARKELNKPKLEKLYFIEKINKDSSVKGFEFMNKLPLSSEYIFHISNNITELKVVKTKDDSMSTDFDWNEEELNKFPRFKKIHKQRKQEEKSPRNPKYTFPYVLCTNIFIEIPRLLRSLDDITKFLEPFENISFKTLRSKFTTALKYCLEPKSEVEFRHLLSTQRWKVHHFQHRRRLFNEQQRLGLYYAMNKHKVYPNYWIFYKDYYGMVRYIEFFEFLQNKCESKRSESQQQQQQQKQQK